MILKSKWFNVKREDGSAKGLYPSAKDVSIRNPWKTDRR